MREFYTLLTKYGLNKIVYARSQNLPIKLSKIVVGDGEIVPSEEMTSLKSPKHTININEIRQDEKNKNYLILTGVIPTDIGGFYINEIGVLDDSNKLFAIGNMAKTYKPLLSEGSAKEVIIEIIIEVANASEVVINIDNSIVLATREWVKNEIKNIYTKLNDYYTKGQSDAKFELKGFGYSKAELNALIDKKPNLDAVYTKATSDQRYLGINAKAKDSDKLDGLDSSSFARAGSSYSKAEIDAKFGDGVLPFGARAGVVIGGGRFLKTINCNITETPRVQLLGGKWDSLYYLINLNFANATAVNMCFFEEEIKTENIGEKNDTKYEYKLSTIELIKHSNKAFKIPKRNVDGKSPSNDLKQYLGRKIHKGAHSGFILFF